MKNRIKIRLQTAKNTIVPEISPKSHGFSICFKL